MTTFCLRPATLPPPPPPPTMRPCWRLTFALAESLATTSDSWTIVGEVDADVYKVTVSIRGAPGSSVTVKGQVWTS